MGMIHWIYYVKLNNVSASGSVAGPEGHCVTKQKKCTGEASASLSSVGHGWLTGDVIKQLETW